VQRERAAEVRHGASRLRDPERSEDRRRLGRATGQHERKPIAGAQHHVVRRDRDAPLRGLARSRQRGELRDLRSVVGPERMPEIPIGLEAQPEVRTHPGHLGEPEGCIRRDGAFTANDLIQARYAARRRLRALLTP